LFGSLSFQLLLEGIDLLFQLSDFFLQFIILGFQLLDISVRGRTEALFNEFDGVGGLFWLLVETNKDSS
jgi:hypothetical protein